MRLDLTLPLLVAVTAASAPALGRVEPSWSGAPVPAAEVQPGGELPGGEIFKPDHLGQMLAATRAELAAGRFAAARDAAMVIELWGERSGDLAAIAQAQLHSGLALAALGERDAACSRLRPAIVELTDAGLGADARERLEGRLTLIRLDWLTGRDDAALAAWSELRPELGGAAAIIADLFLAEACLQAAMPEAARVHVQRALLGWRASESSRDGELDVWCRYGRSLGWAGSFDGQVACRLQVGVQAHLLLARCAYLMGEDAVGQAAEASARGLWPGPDFEQAASLWPARLRLALAREDSSGVEALIAAARAREALAGAQQDDLGRAWQLDWSASLEPWTAAKSTAEVGVAEASFSSGAEGSLGSPPLLERRERLRAWLDRLAPDWMPLPMGGFGPGGPGAGGPSWVPVWVRALGVLGGLGLSVLGGVTLLQSRRSCLLERRLSELERARESLVREAAAMSHDLKSPVLTMRCALDLLGLDSSDPAVASRVAPLEQSMDHILRLADRSLELHLLRNSSSGAGAEALEMISFGRSVVERWSPLASDKRIELIFEAQPAAHGGVLWELPRDHAERLLDNLISNALKYSYPGGRVEVRVDEVLVSGRREGVLSVRDTGVGLRVAELPRFFEPLSGLSSEPTDGEPSTGLGTAIVEAIARRYGGRAEVEAREDRSGLLVRVRWKLR